MNNRYCLRVDESPTQLTANELECIGIKTHNRTVKVGDVISDWAIIDRVRGGKHLRRVRMLLNRTDEYEISVEEAIMWGFNKFESIKPLKVMAFEDKVVFIKGEPWSGIVPVLDYAG